MKIRDIMTSPAVTVSATDHTTTVAKLLAERGFTAVPVVDDDDALVGIITEGDLLTERLRPDPRVHGRVAPPRSAPPTTVALVMTTPVESVTPGDDAADVAEMMVRERIRCFPVVDGRHIVGVVTRRDLLSAGVIHPDEEIRSEIVHGLRTLTPAHRWQVTVQGGVADIEDFLDSPLDRERAEHVAAQVPGVISTRVIHQTPDPF